MIGAKEHIVQTTAFFKLLSDPTRVRILSLLSENPEGLCVYEIADTLGLSHSAVSHQLAKLEARGIAKSYREGQSVCYELKKSSLTATLMRMLKTFNNNQRTKEQKN